MKNVTKINKANFPFEILISGQFNSKKNKKTEFNFCDIFNFENSILGNKNKDNKAIITNVFLNSHLKSGKNSLRNSIGEIKNTSNSQLKFNRKINNIDYKNLNVNTEFSNQYSKVSSKAINEKFNLTNKNSILSKQRTNPLRSAKISDFNSQKNHMKMTGLQPEKNENSSATPTKVKKVMAFLKNNDIQQKTQNKINSTLNIKINKNIVQTSKMKSNSNTGMINDSINQNSEQKILIPQKNTNNIKVNPTISKQEFQVQDNPKEIMTKDISKLTSTKTKNSKNVETHKTDTKPIEYHAGLVTKENRKIENNPLKFEDKYKSETYDRSTIKQKQQFLDEAKEKHQFKASKKIISIPKNPKNLIPNSQKLLSKSEVITNETVDKISKKIKGAKAENQDIINRTFSGKVSEKNIETSSKNDGTDLKSIIQNQSKPQKEKVLIQNSEQKNFSIPKRMDIFTPVNESQQASTPFVPPLNNAIINIFFSNTPSIISQISQYTEAVKNVSTNVAKFKFDLNNHDKLEIQFSKQGENQSLKIIVNNESTLQHIEKILPEIKLQFENRGISFASLDLQLQNKNERNTQSEQTKMTTTNQKHIKAGNNLQESVDSQILAVKNYGYNTIEILA